MKAEPIVIEETFHAPPARVWEAITDPQKMQQWYFDIKNFRPEAGFVFQFYGGNEEKQYLHLCTVTEVITGKKFSYSWRYENYPGNSLVTFELFAARLYSPFRGPGGAGYSFSPRFTPFISS